jgi:hypothetical protein
LREYSALEGRPRVAGVHGISKPAELALEPVPDAPSLEPAARRGTHAAAFAEPAELRRAAAAVPNGQSLRWPFFRARLLSAVAAGAMAHFWTCSRELR